MTLSRQVQERLRSERNIWVATVRPDSRPHLTPVWFAWQGGKIYVCIKPVSVKALNVAQNPNVALSLEDGSSVVICEGEAAEVPKPWPEAVLAVFREKYNWEITTDSDGYTLILAVTPQKWLVW